MSDKVKKLAILISDICGSTSLYEEMGDDAARQRVEKGIATMIGELPAYRGMLVNAIGDQILCTFPTPELALLAACAMQQAVRHCSFEDNYKLKIRIGLHFGDVILGDETAFGDAINVTARVAAIASANQIMTTAAVYNALPPALKTRTIQFMSTSLKGKLHAYDIYIVLWEQDDTSVTCINVMTPRKPQMLLTELTLFYADQRCKVNEAHRIVTIGRGDDCDITVNNVYASRHHVRCELRSGNFLIVDTSINGTYVRVKDGKVIRLVREEMILQDAGVMSLGQDTFENANELVEFMMSLNDA